MTDTCCALTITLPAFPAVQRLRAQLDPAYSRWPVHFNVDCFPFYPAAIHDDLAPRIQAAVAGLAPFVIRIGAVQCFDGKKGTMYGAVECADDGAARLHAALMAAFPELDPKRPFHPHVTLGRFDNKTDLHRTTNAVNLAWTPIVHEVTCLTLISRTRDGAFVATHEFLLGGTSWRRVLIPYTVTADDVAATAVATATTATTTTTTTTTVTAASAIGFPLGTHWVCTLRAGSRALTKKRMMNVIVVDNSASMGPLSRAAISTIGRGMFQFGDAVTVVPGVVIVFSATAYVASNNVRHADDLNRIVLPSQCNTNITAGVDAAVKAIVDAAPPPDTHIVITFLSDGAHNQGPMLDDRMLATLRSRLEGLSVSVIVVGVGSSSDTSLGMKIKTALETVAVPGLDSIYFAPTPSAMDGVLTRLQRGLGDHVSSGGAVHVRCPTHVFTDTGTHDAVVYVSADGDAVVVVSGGVATMPPVFVLEAGPVPVVVVDMDPSAVTEAVDAQVVRLSQLSVARGIASIRTGIEDTRSLIQACTTAMKPADLPVWSSLRPGQRAAALKAFRRSEVSFREQLNRLDELRCGVANDSARQAAFLTGMQSKFGAKAVRRAGVVDAAMSDVVAQISTTIAAFDAAESASELATGDTSFMSLNTPAEQLAEWVGVDPTTVDEPYAALVSYGMCGFPVRMAHTAAVQMDPWQTACIDVEPYLVDTGSLLLANQTGHAIIGPMHQTVTDVIAVVHPECEGASRASVRSVVNQYLCSVTLCRDLYMYQPAMTLSMHAHVFLKAVSKFVDMGASSAYLRLALQLVYSLRVLHGGGVNGVLLKHWLQDWGTLTTGAADECKHPLQVIIALATATYDDRNDYAAMSLQPTGAMPLLTLLCEVVSRRCRGAVRGGGIVAADLLGAMYGINAGNSPTANEDAMSPEPENVIVRRSCPPSHTLHPEGFPSRAFDGAASVHTWVRSIITPYYHAFRLGHVLQKLRVWTDDSPNTAVFALQDTIAAEFAVLPEDPLQFMGVTDGVLETMFAQGMLYNDSDTRVGGALGDVRDARCMHELLVDVHMVRYAASCEDKSRRWAATIGDVTAGAATAANLDTFLSMVGIHTHGLSKKVFWSMLRVAKATAARGDTSKKDAFLGKSNSTVPQCFHDKKTKKHDASS
jgi:2'-5' RNA ligase/Mg-chelatase subunit ChlD